MKSKSLLARLIVPAVLMALCAGGNSTQAQDITSGTGVVITRSFVRSVSVIVTTGKAREARSAALVRQTTEMKLLAEDAIALGNAQQEALPPRYDEAERAYQLASKLNRRDARPFAWLGDLNVERQRFPAAETALKHAITLDPADAISYVRLSYMYSKLGRFDEADEAARRVQTLRPNEYYGYCSIGWSKFKRQSYAEAETAYRRAIELSPKTSGLYSDLALILINRGRMTEAADFLQRALRINPNDVSALTNYGVVLQQSGDLERALENYQRAAQLAPRATQPRANAGMIYYLRGDAVAARKQWELAVRFGSAYQLDRLGLLALDGKLKEARAALETFTAANAANPDGWLLLGDVSRAQTDHSNAQTAFERAEQIAPEYAKQNRSMLQKASDNSKKRSKSY